MRPFRARARALRAIRLSSRPVNRPTTVDRLEPRTLMTTFVVTTVADGGPGSLREAIELANLSAIADAIRFNIPGEGVYRTIAPQSPLPVVTAPLTIDATSQPGYVSSPVVELDGAEAGPVADGLTISGPQCVVRGLAINRFGGHGVAVTGFDGRSQGGTGARLESNYIGTDVTGNLDLGNGGAGVMVAATGVAIGPPAASLSPVGPNVISGNGFAGVWVNGGTSNIGAIAVSGNLIGTNAAGNLPIGNDREGILIDGAVLAVTVGGDARGGGTIGNVISGNAGSGVRVSSPSTSSSVTLIGNSIGIDKSGANALGNGRSAALPYRDGVTFIGGNIRIGGTASTLRNVISSNAGAGIAIYSATDAVVVGNYIGTDSAGNADRGNGGDGVAVVGAAATARVTGNLVSGNRGDGVRATQSQRSALTIGGNYIGTNAAGTSALGNDGDGVNLTNITVTAAIGGPRMGATTLAVISPSATGGNTISGNGGHGIHIRFDSAGGGQGYRLTGNYIGADITGSVPIGNAGSGIHIAAPNVTVGGTTANEENVIAANGGNGITIVGPSVAVPTSTVGARIERNRIGVGAVRGSVPNSGSILVDTGMGNRANGIAVFYSSNNRIGGTAVGSGNMIAYNGANGILVQGTRPGGIGQFSAAEGNAIQSNAFYGNGKLAIDLALASEGVTPNDPGDADLGPNQLQNHPVITEAAYTPATRIGSVRFTLHSRPLTTYRIEFFASIAPDSSGRGEGQVYVGALPITTDGAGNGGGTFTATVPVLLPSSTAQPAYVFFTATATTAGGTGNTSEFSPAVRAGATLSPLPVPLGSALVVGRHVFYNNSAFDQVGGDDAAIAPDKQALLPGGAPSFANVTSYSRGLNGVMVDVAGLPAGVVLTPDEFAARVADAAGSTFRDAPKPASVTVRRGAGINGSDRVTLYWSDNLPRSDGAAPAVLDGWLEVKMLASAVTGLAASDVFYFGNLAGETGNPSTAGVGVFRVDWVDLARARAAAPLSGQALSSRFDHDRDGDVDASDLAVARAHYGRWLNAFSIEPVAAAAMTSSRLRPATRERLAEVVLA